MVRECPYCLEKQHSLNSFTCEYCKADIIENGQLIDSLIYWDTKKPAVITKILLPLGIVTASGVATAAFDQHLILLFGIAAAAVYYVKQSKSST